MTANEIETAFYAAAGDFNDSLLFMQPYRRGGSEGYCEANIVEYFSHTLRQIGFRPFLEFPIARGRVDALFFRDSTFLLLEGKQLYRENVAYIQSDLARLTTINVSALLNAYGFTGSVSQAIHIAVCDCWSDRERTAWTADPVIYPFLSGYTTRAVVVPSGSAINQPYSWLLAYR